MNEVQIDETRLAAEADAALAAAPVDESAAPVGTSVAPVQESWAPVVGAAVPMLRIAVLPQWDISEAEYGEFQEAMGQCLDQLFPGGLDGPYACWVRLIVCIGGVTAKQVIIYGKLPPIGPRRAVSEKAKPAASADAPAH